MDKMSTTVSGLCQTKEKTKEEGSANDSSYMYMQIMTCVAIYLSPLLELALTLVFGKGLKCLKFIFVLKLYRHVVAKTAVSIYSSYKSYEVMIVDDGWLPSLTRAYDNNGRYTRQKFIFGM